VVIDLEDAVPPAEKEAARGEVARLTAARDPAAWPPILVRINSVQSGLARGDIDEIMGPGLAGLRIPKAQSAEEVQRLDDWIATAETREGIAEGTVRLQVGIETAHSILAAGTFAVTPRVVGFFPGEADLIAGLGLSVSESEEELLVSRSLLVLASSKAGLNPPVQSVYTRLRDLEGLRASTERGKRLGFFGRSAIHPEQVPVINEVFTPSAEELERARTVLEGLKQSVSTGRGTLRLPDGTFVDAPVAQRAQRTVMLAEQIARQG
jgi:citrate lyase subunit beta/citryl-CoA lyase